MRIHAPVMLIAWAAVLADLDGGIEDRFPQSDRPADSVSAALFVRINRDRAEHDLGPLLWDERAASVARISTRRQIEEGTFGHFLLDGFPPYARLAGGGDFGFGSENVAAFMSDAGRLHESPEGLALHAQSEMMRETPPHDSHRRTILDPGATHVGIGWAIQGGDFRIAAEFTRRGYEWLRVTRYGRNGGGVHVAGQARRGMNIAYVSVSRQPVPKPISRERANNQNSYSYPPAQRLLLPASSRELAVGLPSLRSLIDSFGGNFSFDYPIDEPGLWTFVLYFKGKAAVRPEGGGQVTLLVNEADGRR